MYSYVNALLPPALNTMFKCNNAVHSYNTRQSTNPHFKRHITKSLTDSFVIRGPQLWQGLPQHIKDAKTVNSFKSSMKRAILDKSSYTG